MRNDSSIFKVLCIGFLKMRKNYPCEQAVRRNIYTYVLRARLPDTLFSSRSVGKSIHPSPATRRKCPTRVRRTGFSLTGAKTWSRSWCYPWILCDRPFDYFFLHVKRVYEMCRTNTGAARIYNITISSSTNETNSSQVPVTMHGVLTTLRVATAGAWKRRGTSYDDIVYNNNYYYIGLGFEYNR